MTRFLGERGNGRRVRAHSVASPERFPEDRLERWDFDISRYENPQAAILNLRIKSGWRYAGTEISADCITVLSLDRSALTHEGSTMTQLSSMTETSTAARRMGCTGDSLPLVVFPRRGDADHSLALQACTRRYLPRLGSTLFRGFGLPLDAFVAPLGAASTGPNTLCPVLEPLAAGQLYLGSSSTSSVLDTTVLADARAVFESLPSSVRTRLQRHGVRMVRSFGERLGTRWQDVFRKTDRASVERSCRESGAELTWTAQHGVRIERLGRGFVVHPVTGERVWADVPALLCHAFQKDRESGGVEVRYADGARIEDSALGAVREAFAEHASHVDWDAGDVLALDRLLVCVYVPQRQLGALRYAIGSLV